VSGQHPIIKSINISSTRCANTTTRMLSSLEIFVWGWTPNELSCKGEAVCQMNT
jgi:hypothetical protein